MFYLLYFKFALQLSSFNAPQCPADLIYQKVDKLVKKRKINLEYKKTIKETICCYIVEYWPTDTMTLGGGIKAVVCKQNCEVINYKLYQ
jgi:hypothetical protein